MFGFKLIHVSKMAPDVPQARSAVGYHDTLLIGIQHFYFDPKLANTIIVENVSLTLTSVWVSNYIHHKVCDEFTHPFPKF